MADSNLVKCGALWKHSGEGYSGTVEVAELKKVAQQGGKIRIVLFKNGYKEENKHPDLILYCTNHKEAEEPKAKGKGAKHTRTTDKEKLPAETEAADDIDF